MLAMNLGTQLNNALQGRGCRVVGSDVLLQTRAKDIFIYPEVMVICGQVVRMEGRPSVMTNPVFVAEVLSSSTEAEDRGVKSKQYRATPSIRQYALLSQDRPEVEIYTRDEDGKWWIGEVNGLDAECVISSLDCSLPMASLYEGVLEA